MNRKSMYFSHDTDAMNDPKCMLLIAQLGMEGYGAFWALVETLRSQPDYKLPLSLIPALSARLNITAVKLETVIKNYNLFLFSEDCFFFSKSLNDRMQLMNEKTQRKILSGIKSGEARRAKGLMLKEHINEQCSNNINTNTNKNIIYGEPKDSPHTHSFEEIWKMYECKGNKKTSFLKWNKLSATNKKKVAEYIPAYVAATPEKQFRKNFEVFLNKEEVKQNKELKLNRHNSPFD